MTSFIELLKKQRGAEKKFFDAPYEYARKIKGIARDFIPDAEVYLFGSVRRQEAKPGSDIDLLIYSPKMPDLQQKRAEISADVSRQLGYRHPFELHFANDDEFDWYRDFGEFEKV